MKDVNTTSFDLFPFPKEKWYILPLWEVLVKTITFVPLIGFGIFGNSLLLHIICTNRALKTPTNYLIANMVVADLSTLIICPVMFLTHDFFQNYKLGWIGCKTEGMLECTFLITAVLSLCAISYDRLTAIVLPMETRLSLKSAKIIICCAWTCGFILASPLAFYRSFVQRQWLDFLEEFCTENTIILPIYWHVLIAALVWFPLTIQMICYAAIFWQLDRYEQRVRRREHPISVCYKRKCARTIFLVLIAFVVLRLPFTSLIFVRNRMLQNHEMDQVEGSFQILWYVAHYLIFLNAALTPVIYGCTNDNFRRAFRERGWSRWMVSCNCDCWGRWRKKQFMLSKATTLQEYNLQSLPDFQLKNSVKPEEPRNPQKLQISGLSIIQTPVDDSRKTFNGF